jgi:hypothetical protein
VENITCNATPTPAPAVSSLTATSVCQDRLRIPRRLDFDSNDFLANTFTEEAVKIGRLEATPKLYFALLLGIKYLLEPEQRSQTVLLNKSADGHYRWINGDDFSYAEYADHVRVRWAESEIDIDM